MSKYIKSAVAVITATFAAAKASAGVTETAKVTPLVATFIGWVTDYAGAVSLVAGAAYAVLLVAHKVYQFRKEVKNDRRIEEGK